MMFSSVKKMLVKKLSEDCGQQLNLNLIQTVRKRQYEMDKAIYHSLSANQCARRQAAKKALSRILDKTNL